MKHRILTGLAVVPLTLAVLAAGPATVSSKHLTSASARQPVPVEMAMAASVGEPAKRAADSFATLAGAMVVGAAAAFAGTGMVRRRKGGAARG